MSNNFSASMGQDFGRVGFSINSDDSVTFFTDPFVVGPRYGKTAYLDGTIITFKGIDLGPVAVHFNSDLSLTIGVETPTVSVYGTIPARSTPYGTNYPAYVSTDPTQTGPVPWGYERSYNDYLADLMTPEKQAKLALAKIIQDIKFAPKDVTEIYTNPDAAAGVSCFPAGTKISIPNNVQVCIEDIQADDSVLAYNNYGILSPRKVTQLFCNVTNEWVTLKVQNRANSLAGNFGEITSTPGHHFLCPDGQFRRLCDMIDTSIIPLNSDALAHKEGAEHYRPIGMVEIVLEDGTIAKAEAHSIKYSAATAHLYEEAEMLVTRTEGGLAVKPEMKKGWKTYNFEVAEHHTYIADGIDPAANDNFRGRAAA